MARKAIPERSTKARCRTLINTLINRKISEGPAWNLASPKRSQRFHNRFSQDLQRKEKITMVIAISRKPRKYVLKDSQGVENPPTFLIRRLTAFEVAECQDELTGGASVTALDKPENIIFNIKPSRMIGYWLAILQRGLSGWENLKDEEGTVIEFSAEDISLLSLLSRDVLAELAEAITGITVEAEKTEKGKNPDTPATEEKRG